MSDSVLQSRERSAVRNMRCAPCADKRIDIIVRDVPMWQESRSYASFCEDARIREVDVLPWGPPAGMEDEPYFRWFESDGDMWGGR